MRTKQRLDTRGSGLRTPAQCGRDGQDEDGAGEQGVGVDDLTGKRNGAHKDVGTDYTW